MGTTNTLTGTPLDEPVLTPEQIAKHLGCNPRTVYLMIREGRLPAFKLGRTYRITASAYREFTERHVTPDTDVARGA